MYGVLTPHDSVNDVQTMVHASRFDKSISTEHKFFCEQGQYTVRVYSFNINKLYSTSSRVHYVHCNKQLPLEQGYKVHCYIYYVQYSIVESIIIIFVGKRVNSGVRGVSTICRGR